MLVFIFHFLKSPKISKYFEDPKIVSNLFFDIREPWPDEIIRKNDNNQKIKKESLNVYLIKC